MPKAKVTKSAEHSKDVQTFMDKVGYTSESDADKVDYTFLAAIKAYADGKFDELALAEVADAFEANPAIHDTLYNFEIHMALDIPKLKKDAPERMKKTLADLYKFYLGEMGVQA